MADTHRILWIVSLALRATQILFAIIVLGTSAYVVSNSSSSSYSGYYYPYYYGRKLMGAFDEGLQGPARHLLQATSKGSSGFGVFAGLVGFLAAIFFLVMDLKPAMLKKRLPVVMAAVEASVSGVIAVFFLAAGAAYSSLGSCSSGTYCGNFNAANAFSWLSFFVWTASTVFVVLAWTKVFPRGPAVDKAGAAPKTADAPKMVELPAGAPPQVYAQPTYAPPTGYAPQGVAPAQGYPAAAAAAAANPVQSYAEPTFVKTSDLPAASGPVINTTEMDLEAGRVPNAP